jgi:PAS domain S-box-containing protein
LTIYDTRSASPLLDLLFEGDLVDRCLVAPDGTVLRANAAWFRSTGFSPDDVLGANIIDLFPGTRDMASSMHARARAGHRVEVPRHTQSANGREIRWEGRIDPVPMDGGTGLLITGREGGPAVSNQAHSETEALLRLALDTGQMVAWDYNPTTRRVTVSEYAADLLAVRLGRLHEPSIEDFLPFHPDDVEAHSIKVIEATKRGGAYVSEFRRVREDGEVIWLEERGRSVMDGFGGARIVGITQNVTERKRAEMAVRESEERLLEATHRLTVATEAARLGIHDYDVVSGVIWWDARVRDLWGVGPDEPITYETFMAGLHPDDRAATQAAVDGALDPHGDGRYLAQYRVLHRRDGRVRWIEATGKVRFVGGKPSRLIGAVQDITGRKHTEETAREAAGTP